MLSEIALKNADIDTIRQYTIMGTTVPGLEKIVASQIKELFPTSTIVDIQRGKVFFEVKASIMQLTSIKCVDNLYYFIKSMPSGTTKDDIRLLVREILSTPFSSFIPFLCSSKRPILIHVTASRSGKHSFSRTYVANMALQALLSCECFSLGDVEQHDLHFRLDVIERVTYLSIKITSAAYRYRGNNREFMPGAIRPSIANSLIWLSRPNKNDVVLDPFCGSGTIVSEREYYPYRKILASILNKKLLEPPKVMCLKVLLLDKAMRATCQ